MDTCKISINTMVTSHLDYFNVCGPELGRTSVVCVATLLVPHGPDLIPKGCPVYCKGGTPQLHPSITVSLV